MGPDETTDVDSITTRGPGEATLVVGRFIADLRAGLGPRIEAYLDGQDPSSRLILLRELVLAERDWRRGLGLSLDSHDYRARFPAEATLIDEALGCRESTVTLTYRDQTETEAGLLFGLLAMANGLIAAGPLTEALEVWSNAPGRSLREIFIERGDLDESAAGLVDVVVTKHLDQHHGIAWNSLIALGKAVRFRLDPGTIANSELRVILAGFVASPADSEAATRGGGEVGFGPRYEIVKHHASGGLGVVSLARDEQMHREVALKEIRADCADNPDYRARFLREAEVTGRLEHPGIVPVYGMGHHDDGRPFYIMRFIRGETLKAAIGRLHKPEGSGEEVGSGDCFDLHALLGRFVDACHAMAYAHHRKVLHRDIKPINIMLGPYGETLVVDWGLAKTFDGPRSDEYLIDEGTLRPESGSGMTPTRVGSQVGTTGYMSPEQAAGRLVELGPTSDIYSLGVTLHYLITGHAPFEGAGKEEFLRRVREGDFPRPRKVDPTIPKALEAISLKAMALRPIDRYQSAEALVEDLERWRAGQPVEAYPEPSLERLARWARRHETPLAGAAVLLISATIGLALFAAQERQGKKQVDAALLVAKQERGKAEDERLIAEESRSQAEANLKVTRDSLRMALARLAGPELAYLPNSGPIRSQFASDVVEIYRDLSKKHPTDPGVRFELADACRITADIGRSMGQFEPARRLYTEAIGLQEQLIVEDPRSDDYRLGMALVRQDSGEHLRMAGQPRAAETEQLKALDALKLVGGVVPQSDDRYQRAEATALINLAAARLETGRPLEALPQARRAVEILTSLVERPRATWVDRLHLIYAMGAEASSLKESGDREKSWKDLDEAARIAQELRKSHDNTDTRFALAMILDEQGRFLIESGKPADAVKIFDTAHAYLTDLWKRNQRFVFLERELAISWKGRGEARLALHRVSSDPKLVELALADCTKAREYFEKTVATWPGNFEFQSQLGRTLASLGRIALIKDDRKKARELLELAIARHQLACKANPESPDDTKLLEELGDELQRIGPGAAGASPVR